MARDITAGFQTEIEARELNAGILVRLAFDSGDIFIHSGYGSFDWNGDTYLGAGHLLAIEAVQESSIIKAIGTTLVLSGVETSLISIALQENYQGRAVWIWFAVQDGDRALIADPYLIFKGEADLMRIQVEEETAQIGVTVENELIDLFKARERNYTPEDQKTIYPSDKGLDFIKAIQDSAIVWKDSN